MGNGGFSCAFLRVCYAALIAGLTLGRLVLYRCSRIFLGRYRVRVLHGPTWPSNHQAFIPLESIKRSRQPTGKAKQLFALGSTQQSNSFVVFTYCQLPYSVSHTPNNPRAPTVG
ncbi:hypothetical protein K458DRAFT_31291 [Lentithecium fluviatile CBS 122367]|uniref:Uncharacterized protein n=1 Tax=Lentithecium fluviatile CBS 122367 TaxID=1168545 RepID=A0A6G1J2M0_9PLEO|nr:hypothetical protein K458DRAFT_31291 [Lentithecium fluviatile CBS 122367]